MTTDAPILSTPMGSGSIVFYLLSNTIYTLRAPEFTPGFLWVRVAHLFSFVCLRPVSCVLYAASVSGLKNLSILNCPFGFLCLLTLIIELVLLFTSHAV